MDGVTRYKNNSVGIIVDTLKKENERLKLENDLYRSFNKTLYNKEEIYSNLKALFDTYHTSDNSIRITGSTDLSNQLNFFIIYALTTLQDDEFYGVIIRYLLSNSTKFSNDLNDYKQIIEGGIIDSVLKTENHKILREVVEGMKIDD